MKNKIISIIISLVFLFTSLISINAMAPTPRVDLNDYEITVTGTSNVYISGTVNIAKGQNVALFDSIGKIPLNYTTVENTDSSASFKLQIPSRVLKTGDNTFKVISMPIRGILNSSKPKTITVKVGSSKQNQIITASNLSLYLNETKNLNAKTNSNLPLTYFSDKPEVATVDKNGKVAGNKVGTAKITISQAGNSQYNAASKVITVTVKAKTSTPSNPSQNTYTIVFNSNGGKGSMSKQIATVNKSITLSPNKFKREGYEFVGWAIKSDMASLPKNYKRSGIKSNFSKSNAKKAYVNNKGWYKNINMKHFQLGKVTYKNKAAVKNLAAKNKQIVLYAVWKGNGPQAAVDWGHIIANEDLIWYGAWHPSGSSCMICHPSKKNSYVCNVFALACYTHGTNNRSSCHVSGISHSGRSWTKRNSKLTHGHYKYIGKPSFSKLKPGDIILRGDHTWIYGGKNIKLESDSSKGTKNNKRKSKQIAWESGAKKAYKDSRVTGVVRYIP